MYLSSLCILPLLAIFGIHHGHCYKILAVFPTPFYSHYKLASKILKELVLRGHEVTVVSPYPQEKPIENFTDISVSSLIAVADGYKKNFYSLQQKSVFENTIYMAGAGCALAELVLKHENVQKLLRAKEKYDLVLLPQFINEAFMSIGQYYSAPIVLISATPLPSWGNFLLGLPTSSAYTPNFLTDYTSHMTFWQRVCNTFYDLSSVMLHQLIFLPHQRRLVKKYMPGSPDLYEATKNASLLLINSHMSVYDAHPHAPHTIEIGGFHIEKNKGLPFGLKKFFDKSKNGVVIFSMGSNLRSSDLPPSKVNEILRSFSKLKQNVLWKWEDEDLPGKPDNVRIMKWIPQSDCLAHPNTRAFITHGGLLSTIESVYYGVPLIGIPIFGDQKMNIAAAISNGYALEIIFSDLTEKTLSNTLNEILNNPKYRNVAKRRSVIMRDRPMKPLDTAIYWIEYVVRHKGAPHLKYAGIDLAWYQRCLLDVYLFMIVTLLILTFVFLYLFVKLKKLYFSQFRRKDKIL